MTASETDIAAVRADDVDKLQQFIADGADVNQLNEEGESLLHIACQQGNYEAAKWLTLAGAKLELRDKQLDCTPLLYACIRGELALQLMASPNTG